MSKISEVFSNPNDSMVAGSLGDWDQSTSSIRDAEKYHKREKNNCLARKKSHSHQPLLCLWVMKDKLLTQLLGAASLCFCVQHGAAQ